MSTCVMPMSFICSTAISPVKAPQPVKLQFCGVTSAPLVNLPVQYATCRGDGQTYTSHLLVSQALMLAMRPSSADMDSGLHFQLPPTTGLRARRAVAAAIMAAAAVRAPARWKLPGALVPARAAASAAWGKAAVGLCSACGSLKL